MSTKELAAIVFFIVFTFVMVLVTQHLEDKRDRDNKELYITCIDQIQNKEMCASLLK